MAINSQRLAVNSPDKVLAVGAESRLLEEARDEAMILHVVDVFLLQSALPATIPQQQLAVHQLLLQVLFRHYSFGAGDGRGACVIILTTLLFYYNSLLFIYNPGALESVRDKCLRNPL